MQNLFILFVLVLFLFLSPTYTISFTIEAQELHCFYEDFEESSSVYLDFQVLKGGNFDIDFLIKNSNGNNVYSLQRSPSGQYSFFVRHKGLYSFCFDNTFSSVSKKDINFNLQSTTRGKLAQQPNDSTIPKDRENLAKKEQFVKLAERLERLSVRLDELRQQQSYLKIRERVHRDTTESTNSRVLWWSLLATAFIVCASIGQIYYLRKVFEKKQNV
ncbi:hypothetical protein M0812_29605 [Anaeramoeba flamelloides]|uniref:GOLD domain-containing protein n=1 Tax=Anaeramoeba flamelloides TaxID=1746091 RepID=A0AAV7Y368_9EUKA|nr:hypothetical protein M0812_29605 [Anaeramoeba flamelloides]